MIKKTKRPLDEKGKKILALFEDIVPQLDDQEKQKLITMCETIAFLKQSGHPA